MENEQRRNGFVIRLGDSILKTHTDAKKLQPELHCRLKRIDPDGHRFGYYTPVSLDSILEADEISNYNNQLEEGITLTSIAQTVPVYKPWIEKITKVQRRHLQRSLEILMKNNIIHGDIIGNVMLNPRNNNLPIIIDFDEGQVLSRREDECIDLSKLRAMDMATFNSNSNFKMGHPPA